MTQPPQAAQGPPDPEELPAYRRQEHQRRVLYSLLQAPVALARTFEMPLKEAGGWLEMAYFHQLRKHGETLKEAASSLKVSMRKASMLSTQLRENFFEAEHHHGLPRRIEFLLWAEPMSENRLHQLLRADWEGEQIQQAIESLIEQERVVVEDDTGSSPVYALSRSTSRMYQDRFMVRIDGLNNFVKNVANAIYGRFFHEEERAFARTLTFHLRPEDLPELQRLYAECLFERVAELDELAREQGGQDNIAMDLSICWAPYAYIDEQQGDE